MTRSLDDYIKVDYLPAHGRKDIDPSTIAKTIQVPREKISYLPHEVHTVRQVEEVQRMLHPKLPDTLYDIMARCSIGKPMNRNERRARGRQLRKEDRGRK